MTVSDFLSGVQAIIDSRPTYELGQDGSRGKCDCIGLIIGGLRRAGGRWTGTHGSNWAARNAMVSLTSGLEVGAVVYKAFKPGDKGYSLPEKYNEHPDRLDYYHVGVVLSVSPLRIAHCTTGAGVNGIKVDTTIGRWKHSGRLKLINYDEGKIMDGFAIVSAPNGGTVNLRGAPTKLGNNIIAKPRTGEKVSVLSKDSNWWRVSYNGTIGWMMADFLQLEGETTPIDLAGLVDELEGHATRILAICRSLREVG